MPCCCWVETTAVTVEKSVTHLSQAFLWSAHSEQLMCFSWGADVLFLRSWCAFSVFCQLIWVVKQDWLFCVSLRTQGLQNLSIISSTLVNLVRLVLIQCRYNADYRKLSGPSAETLRASTSLLALLALWGNKNCAVGKGWFERTREDDRIIGSWNSSGWKKP